MKKIDFRSDQLPNKHTYQHSKLISSNNNHILIPDKPTSCQNDPEAKRLDQGRRDAISTSDLTTETKQNRFSLFYPLGRRFRRFRMFRTTTTTTTITTLNDASNAQKMQKLLC